MSILLEVRDLTVGFSSKVRGRAVTPAIDQVHFQIQQGETLGIVGESGCGKTLSTLAVMGLLPDAAVVQSGQILFQGEDLLSLKEKARNRIRGVQVGMVFQDPMTSLSPYYSVGSQIAEALRYHQGMSKKQARTRGIELLDKVGIPSPERVYDEYPNQLSGGMRQRVMIAMAISCEPTLLIADEPTTALDVTTQAQILDLMQSLQGENGMSLILISHDLGVIAQMCQRVMVMYAGQVIEEGATGSLFAQPSHPYTKALLAATPRLHDKQRRFHQIQGQVPHPDEWGDGCRFRSRCEYATEACEEKPQMLRNVEGRRVRCWHPLEAGEATTQRQASSVEV